MNTMGRNAILSTLAIAQYVLSLHAIADVDDFASAFGDQEFVSIATGRAQEISKAPAVTSIITASDIKDMAATTLSEVLESVPGMHISTRPGSYTPLYLIRGIHSAFNPHVLLLINGVPMTNIFVGNRGQNWGGMPVADVARIEVIRGPGSAVYGADAYAGVINVITKSVPDIETVEAGLRYGSFDTVGAWTTYGDSWNDFDVVFSLQYNATDGQQRTIDEDAQSQWDRAFGTSASYAPDGVNLQAKWWDAKLDVTHSFWRARVGYQSRQDMGTGAGVAQALDPEGRTEADRIHVDLTYHNPQIAQWWDFKSQLSYLDVSNRSNLVLFPPGAFDNAYPDGMIGNPYVYERHTRWDNTLYFTGLNEHALGIGVGLLHANMYKTEESKNFNPDGSPIGSVVDVSDTDAVFISENDRMSYYVFLQDEWQFHPDWNFTTGLRFDYYSDFGSTINPRLALVWDVRYDMTSKLLYGRAFRPPAFAEQLIVNNPVALGNPNLNPETIDTWEVVFNYHPASRVSSTVNLFYYKMRNIIQFVADPAPSTTRTAQNAGSRYGYGIEWEAKWRLYDDFHLIGNYAYQNAEDEQTDSDVGYAPHHQFYGRGNWEISPLWQSNIQFNWIINRDRPDNDFRKQIDDYITFDFNLRRKIKSTGMELAVIAKNIFNADVREPSPAPGNIPNDLPHAGRSLFLEFRYH